MKKFFSKKFRKYLSPSFFYFIQRAYRRLSSVRLYFLFIKDYFLFKKNNDSRFATLWRNRFPILGENTNNTNFEPAYTYHPAWAAHVLSQTKPALHIDISSTLNFCAIVSAFVPIKFYDYRPANLKLSGLETGKADLLKLPFADNSLPSLSCMHTVEHIGLGRYGDIIDPAGDLKAMAELKRVLAKGGNLLFVVPIGRPLIQFNAHRIYSYKMILEAFSGLTLKEFVLIPQEAVRDGIIYNPGQEIIDKEISACGCFWFTK